MSQTQSKRKIAQAVQSARTIVQAAGEIHYSLLAFRVGYSPEYFRRTILKLLQEMDECIIVDPKGIVKYICDHENDVEQQAREEAESLFREVGISG